MTESDNRTNQKNIVQEEIPEPSSSLVLELFVYIHTIYIYIYNIILFLLFIFKRFAFDYGGGAIIAEIIIALILLILNIFRLRLTSIGNKTERALILLFAVLIDIVVLVGYIYYMYLQQYVTYFDVVFGAIGLFLTCVEILFSSITMFYIKVHEKNI